MFTKCRGIKELLRFVMQEQRCLILPEQSREMEPLGMWIVKELQREYFMEYRILFLTSKYAFENIYPQLVKQYSDFSDLIVSEVSGSRDKKNRALSRKADVYMITYNTIPHIYKHYKKFDVVIIDDIAEFWNFNTQKYKCVKEHCDRAKIVLGITTCLFVNELTNVWSLFNLLDSGARLGKKYEGFLERYFFKVKNRNGYGYTYQPKNFCMKNIRNKISDISRIYTAERMYEKKIISAELPLGAYSKYLYLRNGYQMRLRQNDSKINLLSMITTMQQVANGFVYGTDQHIEVVHVTKINLIKSITNFCTKKVLIAFWFKFEEAYLRSYIPKTVVLDNEERIKNWNSGQQNIGLVHSAMEADKSLDFEEAEILIWFSLPWYKNIYNALNQRFAKGGGNKTVCHIIMKNTVDELVYHTLNEESVTQREVIEYLLREGGKYAGI